MSSIARAISYPRWTKRSLRMENRRIILMTPGPTEVSFDVLGAMIKPNLEMHDHRVLKAYDETTMMLSKVYQTKDHIIILPGSGRTGMEASVASLLEHGDKVLSVVSGFFGELWVKIFDRLGIESIQVKFPWGKPVDIKAVKDALRRNKEIKALAAIHCETSTGAVAQVEELGEIAKKYGILYLVDAISSLGGMEMRMDDWNIDVCLAASQKCLGAILGLAIIALSEKSFEVMEKRKKPPPSFVYDLLRWKEKGWFKKNKPVPRAYPIYPNPNLIFALHEACESVLEEGLEKRYERHRIARDATVAGLNAIGLDLFPDKDIASNTVSVVHTKNGTGEKIKKIMYEKYGILIQGSIIPELKGKVIRIGHQNLTASAEYVLPTISAIELTLKDLNYDIKLGNGVKAAKEVFDHER